MFCLQRVYLGWVFLKQQKGQSETIKSKELLLEEMILKSFLASYTNNHLMAINRKKTKAMSCNPRRKWDFSPELYFDGGKSIERATIQVLTSCKKEKRF